MALSSSSRPSLRGRVLARLPATLQATGGLKVEKVGGTWTFAPDWSVLDVQGVVADPSNYETWLRNSQTGTYTRMSLQGLAGSFNYGDTIYLRGQPVLYFPDGFVNGSMFIGNGGRFLEHTTGQEGYYNLGVGPRSLTKIRRGKYNVFAGIESGEDVYDNNYNTGFGEATQIYNKAGNGNSTLGWKAGCGTQNVGLGDYNVFAGYGAGLAPTTTVNDNVGVGAFALAGPTFSGDGNIAIGRTAGYSFSTGPYNIVIGTSSQTGVTTGGYNIYIGANINGRPTDENRKILLKADTTQIGYPVGVAGGGSIILTGAGTTLTGTTAKTTLATIPIPGNAMGINGFIRVTIFMNYTGTAGTKTPFIEFGGTTFWSLAAAAGNLSSMSQATIMNNGLANVQVATCLVQANWSSNTTGLTVGAVNTTIAQNVVIACQLANAADAVVNCRYIVEVVNPTL